MVVMAVILVTWLFGYNTFQDIHGLCGNGGYGGPYPGSPMRLGVPNNSKGNRTIADLRCG